MAIKAFTIPAFEEELREILSWWTNNSPEKEGKGFYGRIDNHGKVYPNAPKGGVLNARILWSFAAAARLTGSQEYLMFAQRAFDYLQQFFLDPKNGGLYWMIDANGQPLEQKKQIYAQAFAIYAFSEFYLATGKKDALHQALHLFDLIEQHAFDPQKGGYLEAFGENWEKIEDVRLSDKDANAIKTMNTHLHILECYTNLYRCEPSEKVKKALTGLTKLYMDQFSDAHTGRLKLFFNENWEEHITHDSFGHEIESAWLVHEAAAMLDEPDLLKKSKHLAVIIASRVLKEGLEDSGAVYSERYPSGAFDPKKAWWPQAEGVVGFYDAYKISNQEKFLEASKKCWAFIQKFLKDLKNGEWFWAVDGNFQVVWEEDKAGPWKGPYHNSRMCIEMIKRLKKNED